MLSRKKKLT